MVNGFVKSMNRDRRFNFELICPRKGTNVGTLSQLKTIQIIGTKKDPVMYFPTLVREEKINGIGFFGFWPI